MRQQRGFTLVEVLIAMTLLSMIMVATISALRTFGNTNTTVKQVTNRVDEIRIVSDFLRNSIGGAMPLMRVGEVSDVFSQAANYGTFFAGNASEIVWVSPLVAGADLGGAFVMRLTYRERQLLLRWHTYRPQLDATIWEEIEARALLDAVDEFEIGYLPAHGSEWVDNWRGAQRNPVAVRLTIKARGRYWPELVVRLGAGELNLL